MVADWHGLDPEAPAKRMEELVPLLRRLWRLGEAPVDHEGRFYRVRIAALDDLAPEPVDIPIYTAGVNPRMIESAGRVADGLLGHSLFGPRYIADVVRPALERGARTAGRDPGDVRLTTFALTAVHADEEVARREAAGMIAFYASVKTYAPLLATAGFEREALAVQEAFRRGDADAMVAAVTDRMVDELAVAGTPGQVEAGLRRFDGLADEVVLFPPAFRMPEARIDQTARALIAACAPPFTAASARRPPAAPGR
jgi:alkanesulfonate monooxygenase SsuD/methylene tetrahydromethanopterin reductase-like flavin-dependent oxidoreductase (luciferase family)